LLFCPNAGAGADAGRQYFTNTPAEVQQKILALLQRWNFNLPGQPKIHEAYQMLKSQGIVFPTVVPTDYLNVPCGEGVSVCVCVCVCV
jgi:hypothetical protein